ncbi:MAG TPA: hypothetical protein VND94_07020 [Terriglobia bacterium]|nr:hypothetical protein [Terriglobia bacterium]
MDQIKLDGFLKHYRELPPEDLAALDQQRAELVPEAIAALDAVLQDQATRERVIKAGEETSKADSPRFGFTLSLLLVCLIGYGPLQFLLLIASFGAAEIDAPNLAFLPAWRDFKLAILLFLGALTLISLYTAQKLYRRRERRTVRSVVFALWLLGPLASFLTPAVTDLVVGRENAAAILGYYDWLKDTLRSLVPAALWTFYLLTSKHVRAVYPLSMPAQPETEVSAVSRG